MVEIQYLINLSDTVIFSAATPGQTGDHHVNEQPYHYWTQLFKGFGYKTDNDILEIIKEDLFLKTKVKESLAHNYPYKNMMVFKNER